MQTQALRKSRSLWEETFRRYKKHPIAVGGLVLLLIIIIACFYGILAIDYDTQVVAQDILNKLKPPSREHILGTDHFGRDLFSRILYGSRYSLLIGFTATLFGIVTGGLIGAIAGYFGKGTDNVLMRFMDILIAIPSTLLAIAIVSALGPGLVNIIIAISISDIPGYARVIRSSVLSIKENEFIEASVAVGASHARIIRTHILPNTLAPIIVQATMGVGYDIVAASALSYLGLGIMPPAPEWGSMLFEGQQYIQYQPYLVLFPGLAIMLTVLALNLAGDGLRDSIDPRLKN